MAQLFGLRMGSVPDLVMNSVTVEKQGRFTTRDALYMFDDISNARVFNSFKMFLPKWMDVLLNVHHKYIMFQNRDLQS